MGDSAGGGLALALAQRLVARGGRVPDALVLFSPWVDVALEDDVEQMRALEKTDAILKLAGLRACGRLFAGAAAAGGGARDPRASPLFGDCADERLPKTVVFAATGELLLPQLRRLRDRMPAARYVEAAGVPHGCDWVFGGLPRLGSTDLFSKCVCDGQFSEHILCRTYPTFAFTIDDPHAYGFCHWRHSFLLRNGGDDFSSLCSRDKNVVFLQGGAHYFSDSSRFINEFLHPQLQNRFKNAIAISRSW